MKIAIVLGSIRKERQSHRVAYHLEKMLIQRNIETYVIDLLIHPLSIFGQPAQDYSQLENIKQIGVRLTESDALIFVTPEYHGSFSGVLKNALDHFWIEFHKKPIGIAATSTGKFGGLNAATQLQHVILSLGAYPLPLKLLIPEIHRAFDDSFETQLVNLSKSTNRFLDEFLWFADAVSQKKISEATNEIKVD